MSLIQYYKSSLSKRFDYSKFLYLNTIIMALASFYLFASTTTTLAEAQNATNTNSTEINTLLETTRNLLYQQKYDEAIQNYDKVLQIDPNHTFALNNKGAALSDLGKYDEAIQNFDQILAMNASDVYAINNKAEALAEMGKNEEALSVIEKAAIDNPNDEYLQSTMAFILANLGREDEARTYYEKALQINPNLTEALTVQKEIDAFNKVMGNKTIMQ